MDEPLIDSQGFPRADIDVYQVRHARAAIRALANDHKQVTKRIEEELHRIHANTPRRAADEQREDRDTLLPPFAYVNTVEQESPASRAGLLREDRLVRFGHVNHTNHNQLRTLAEVAANSEGNVVKMVIERRTDNGLTRLTLDLTPQKWSGRGLLGCHILPVV